MRYRIILCAFLALSVVAIVSVSSFVDAQTTGLVAHWTFDEGSGTTAGDSSGSGNTGTLVNGPAWTTGKIGGALNFDGVNDYVSVPSSPSLNVGASTNQVTLAGWVFPRNIDSQDRLVHKRQGATSNIYGLMMNVNRTFNFRAGADGVDADFTSTATLSLNTWNHLAATFDDSVNTVRLYLNGVEVNVSTTFTQAMGSNTEAIEVGGQSGHARWFDGMIDEVRIYNRALSATEVAALFNAGSAPDTTSPTVSISSPLTGATVSGTITVSATASDNVGVAGVQFKLDGANLGAEDTTSPYSISWNTTSATNGSHTLTAVARDAAGNQTTSAAVTVTVSNVADTQAPSTPTGLTATAISSSQIDLSWNASTDDVGVTGYRVYRGGTQIADVTTTSYSDTGLSPSTTYSYTVTAYDAAGNVSGQSSNASATTQAPPLVVFPGAAWTVKTPSEVGLDSAKLDQFASSVGGDGVIIKNGYLVKSWGCVSCANRWSSATKPVFSTLLFFALTEGKIASVDDLIRNWGWNMITKDQSMTFRHLANNVSGYMLAEPAGQAWAYNDYGVSLFQQTVAQRIFGTTNADSLMRAPSRLGALQLEDGGGLDPYNGDPTAGYDLFMSPRDYARIGWFWLNTGNWNGTQLLPQSYFNDYVNVGVPGTFPIASGNLDPNGNYLGIQSNGGPPNDGIDWFGGNGGRGLYGFYWWFNGITPFNGNRYWPDAPADTYAAQAGSEGRLFVIPSLNMVVAMAVPSSDYWGGDAGDPSAPMNQALKLLKEAVTVAPDTTPPTAPATLTASTASQTVNLTWQAASDPESGITGYKVYRKEGTSTYSLLVTLGNVTTYTDSATQPNTTYTYQVSAVNGSGLESTASNEATVLTGDSPPAAPNGFSASAGDQKVTLTWNASSELDLAGYNLYRATSTGGPYAKLNITLLTGTSYTDTGLTNSTTYFYVLRAVDVGGNESPNSAEVSATPTAAPTLGLAAHWKFDEGSGTSASDSSGNGNTGTLVSGPIWTAGKISGALDFDGANDVVNVPSSPSLGIANTITLAAWVKPDSYPNSQPRVVQKRHGPTSSDYGLLVLGSSGAPQFRVSNCSGQDADFTATASLPLGVWSHVAATFDDPTNTVTIYLNGVESGRATSFATAMCATTGEALEVGGQVGHDEGRWWDGRIDDVRIYNRVLTAQEIFDLSQLAP